MNTHTVTHTQTLYVSGMHCSACTIVVADALREAGVHDVQVSISDRTATFSTDRPDTAEVFAARLTPLVAAHGYALHATRPMDELSSHRAREWMIAVIVALSIAGVFVFLDRMGIASVRAGGEGSVVTAFLVGLVASVSSCLAVVGGFVLSLAAVNGRAGGDYRPHVYFHLGRLGGFALLGALLGALGSVVRLSVYGSALLGLLVSVIMLVLGLQLLEVPGVRVPTLSSAWFSDFRRFVSGTSRVAPVLLGMITFFLPCGFTQAMQVAALGSGSMIGGALTMLAFALGTLPVLALLSFGSLDLARSIYRGVFFKTAGLLVIGFALMNGIFGLRVLGIITF